MYSEFLRRWLSDADIDVYDRIEVIREGAVYTGLLMPRPETGDPDCLVIKLSNGYNIGIRISKEDVENGSVRIRLIEKFSGEHRTPGKRTTKEKGSQHSGLKKREGKVYVLGAGGTISSHVEYLTGAVHPAMSEEELLATYPEISEIANIHAETVFSVLSEDMTPSHWSVLAGKVRDAIEDGARGVVITHGTDTMHYTSAALSFMLQNLPVPVILTGAQRSSDRGSSDARLNLLASLIVAKSDFGEVGVCMHANISDNFAYVHRGTKVRKMHTSRRDAFKSVNMLPVLRVDPWSRTIEPLNPYRKTDPKTSLKFDNRVNDNVAMVYIHPGIKPRMFSALSEYDGIVLVGTGLGHVSTNPFNDKLSVPVIKEIRELIDSGIPVVMSSQTIYGRLNLNVYTAGRQLKEAGVIGHLCDWTPETAYAKLCWVLGHTKDMETVKREMETNMVGEISERSIVL